jgi:hypothetical protein
MYTNFPLTKSPEKSLQSIVEKYNTTLNKIENDNSPADERALVDNFFDIKKQVADIYNSMRNNGPVLPTPGNTITPYIPPQALAAQHKKGNSIFVSDMYNGYNGPDSMATARSSGGDYVVRNEILPNPLAQQQQFQRMQQRGNPVLQGQGAMFAQRCINSSFSNNVNQGQFRNDSNVVMMQTDAGSLVPINNAHIYDRAATESCKPAFDQKYFQNEQYTQQNMGMLKSVTKQEYQQNLAHEMARQNEVRAASNPWSNNSLNNPANPIWKPVSSKYVD